MSAQHILMRLQNIHRRARHAQRRGINDAFVADNLEAIERESRLALAEAHDLLGCSAGIPPASYATVPVASQPSEMIHG